MKSHISITIDQSLAEELKRVGQRERRSLSNLLELAASEYLQNRGSTDEVKTTASRFAGTFSRTDTYKER